MFCAYTRPRYQVSVYRTIGPLVKGYNKTWMHHWMILYNSSFLDDLYCESYEPRCEKTGLLDF